MTERLQIYSRWDIAIVPFPFVDLPQTKRRPAVVLTPLEFNQQYGMAMLIMVTSAETESWPDDVPISDIGEAGLKHHCVIRPKIFTIANRRLEKRIGTLAYADRVSLQATLATLLPSGEVSQ